MKRIHSKYLRRNLKRILFVYILFISVQGFSQNQNPYISWEKTFGGTSNENVNCIQITFDGKYLFGGWTISSDGDVKSGNIGGWLVEIDKNGKLLWEKTYSEIGSDGIVSIRQTWDRNYLIGGSKTSINGDLDYILIKVNEFGDVIWEKTYGGSRDDKLKSIQPTSDRNYLLSGYTSSNDGDIKSGNHGDSDFWVLKIDTLGNILWEKTYGGGSQEELYAVQPTSDNCFLIGGHTFSGDGDVKSGNQGGMDCWLIKISENGILQWEKTYGGPGYEGIRSIESTLDGGFVFGGYTESFNGDVKSGNKGLTDCWLVKIDNKGNLQWEKTYGGSGYDQIYSVKSITNGGYVLGCYTTSYNGDIQSGRKGGDDIWVVGVDSEGNLKWERTFGGVGNDQVSVVQQFLDGQFLIGGMTGSNDGDIKSGNHGEYDCWILSIKINNYPTNINVTNLSIDENSSVGTEIGKLTSSDIDSSDTHSYTFVSGTGDTDNDSFNVQGDKLLSNKIFDFETKSSYLVRIQTSDNNGGTFSKTFTINVNNRNESPTDIVLSKNTIDEGVEIGREVGVLTTIDQDFGDTYRYSFVSGLGDEDNDKFSILENKLLTNSILDYETKSTYSLRIETTDSVGNTYVKIFQIQINDVNEPPLDIILSNDSIYENLKLLSDVGIVSSIDDVGDTHTYSLVSGEGDMDNSSFIFLGDQLLTRDEFDYEKKSKYSIRIQTKDGEGYVFSKSFIIYILNVVETGFDDIPNYIDVKLFPNPLIDNRITIETTHSLPLSFSLFDLNGKLLIDKKLVDNISQVSVQRLTKGTYIVQIKNGNKILIQHKIIKK